MLGFEPCGTPGSSGPFLSFLSNSSLWLEGQIVSAWPIVRGQNTNG